MEEFGIPLPAESEVQGTESLQPLSCAGCCCGGAGGEEHVLFSAILKMQQSFSCVLHGYCRGELSPAPLGLLLSGVLESQVK